MLIQFLTFTSNPRGWFYPAAGACVGVYLFYRGFRLLQRKRLIMNTPASKIRSAAIGLVELSGLATGPYTLTAPLTGVPCYYYRSMAWQWKQSGKNGHWDKVADESKHVPFYVDDNTGRVLVNPQGAELDIHCDLREEFSHSLFSSDLILPANVNGFLLCYGLAGDRKLKVEEYCIKPKNALFVLGTLSANAGLCVTPDPIQSETTHRMTMNVGGGILNPLAAALGNGSTTHSSTFTFTSSREQQPAKTVHSTKTLDATQQEKIAAALTKAGISSPAAWRAAGLSGATAAVGTAVAVAADPTEKFDLRPVTVLMRGTHDRSFFISWRSQREVLKSLQWKSALMIWGGPVLTVLCVYILAAEFGWL